MSSNSDFSFFSLFTAGLACLIPVTAAWTQPVGSEPKGNAIYQPGLNSVVPAGKNFTITWDPTTQGTVTLLLLKGPSTNAVPQYAIAEKIDNSGSYTWTPSTDLAPGDTGYGIEIICDKNGQYQYSTQFGISNPNYHAHGGHGHQHSGSWSSEWVSATSSWTTSTTSATASANATSSGTITKTASLSTALPITGNMTIVASTGGMPSNSSIVHPTGSMTVPSSLKTTATASGSVSGAASATGSGAPIQTGAAATMATSFAGLVVAAGVAVFAL